MTFTRTNRSSRNAVFRARLRPPSRRGRHGDAGKERASRRFARVLVWGALVWLAMVGVLAALAGFLGNMLGVSDQVVDLSQRHLPPHWPHLLGTDEVGRDFAMRLLMGARISLTVGIASALVASTFGAVIGLWAGYRGGIWDAVLMRAADLLLTLPVLPLMLILAALDWPEDFLLGGDSPVKIIVLIAAFGWMRVARITRASALSVKERDYVLAARALGAREARVLFVHILPNLLGPILVATTLEIGSHIMYEAALSFLGLGVQPPSASWGNMLSQALDFTKSHPALAFWPGFFILMTVSCIHILGDALRDAMDPHEGRQQP